MPLEEFKARCATMGIEVEQEFPDIDGLTLSRNGAILADVYLKEYGRFTTCYRGTKTLEKAEMKELVFLLAEFSTSEEIADVSSQN